ncbi:MAG: LysR family transcriptional regulator [Brucella sp.]|nr:LysR family transcriptional regulator [Hyphomicrobium zavarzinii]
MYDWNDLRFFLAVARAGTISGAGKLTNTDHATASRRITALESALNTQLFVRNARGYSLTRQGESLLAVASRVEAEAAKVEDHLGEPSQPLSGTIRVTALEGIGNFFLAPRLSAFAARHKHLCLELLTIQQIVAISRRDTDIIVTLSPPNSKRFLQEELTDYRLFVYGSKSYLASKPEIRTAEDLLDHPFAGYVDELIFTRELNYLSEFHKGLKARLQYSSLHGQMQAACSGYGLCVLPAFIASQKPELVAVLPDKLSLKRTYWMIVHEDIASSTSVSSAMEFMRSEVRASRPLFMGEDAAEAKDQPMPKCA